LLNGSLAIKLIINVLYNQPSNFGAKVGFICCTDKESLKTVLNFPNWQCKEADEAIFVTLQNVFMNNPSLRYQYNPMLADTVGFFDYCIPLTDENQPLANDSLSKFSCFGIYDYKTPLPANQEHVLTHSVFANHHLIASPSGPKAIEKQPTDWITMLLLVCLVIFAWIQSNYTKRFRQIFHAAVQPYYVNQLEREGNLFGERITLGLSFIYYSTISIFVYELFIEFSTIPFALNIYSFTAFIFVSLLLFRLIKSGIVIILGIVFNTKDSAHLYQLNSLLFNHIHGTILFPLIIIAFFWESRIFVIISIIISSLLIIYRLYRGILTGLANKNYNLFYLFLYLCTLEILPFLILFKVIAKY